MEGAILARFPVLHTFLWFSVPIKCHFPSTCTTSGGNINYTLSTWLSQVCLSGHVLIHFQVGKNLCNSVESFIPHLTPPQNQKDSASLFLILCGFYWEGSHLLNRCSCLGHLSLLIRGFDFAHFTNILCIPHKCLIYIYSLILKYIKN